MSDASKEFSEFGKKSLILAILYLMAFILSIIMIIPALAGLAYVATWVVFVVLIVFLILAAKNIGKAGDKLNNKDLRSFRTRIIVVVILITLGLIMVTLGFVGYMATIQEEDPGSPATAQAYITFGIIIVIGVVILIIGVVFEVLAWTDMKGFLRDNLTMFPEEIGKSAQTGVLLCMIGAILSLTFLAFIGYLLRAIGYFKLAKLKDLE